MSMKMLVFAIVITIVYVSFSTWRLFINKKKTKLTIVDLGYSMLLGLFTGLMVTDIKIILLIGALLFVWLTIVTGKSSKNGMM